MLIIPLLASEYTEPANLPVFQNILRQLKNYSYLSTIIFGLDRATEEESLVLRDLLKAFGISHYLIQWNDGPGFSNIDYDRDAEESLVKEVFQKSIVHAGELLTVLHRMTERFLRFVHSYEEFSPFVEQGLVDAIFKAEERNKEKVSQMPQTVSWERVSNKLPRIFYDLIEVVESEKRRFS